MHKFQLFLIMHYFNRTIHSCLSTSDWFAKVKVEIKKKEILLIGWSILTLPKWNRCFGVTLENHFCSPSQWLMLNSRRSTHCANSLTGSELIIYYVPCSQWFQVQTAKSRDWTRNYYRQNGLSMLLPTMLLSRRHKPEEGRGAQQPKCCL